MNLFESLFFINIYYFIQIVMFFIGLCIFIYLIIIGDFFPKSNREEKRKNKVDFNKKKIYNQLFLFK